MRFFSDFPRLQCNYTTTISSFNDNKFNSPTLSHQLFLFGCCENRFFSILQNWPKCRNTSQNRKEKKISSRSLLCVLNFPQLQHLMRHTRETRLVSSIFVRCCASHQRKRRSRRNTQKKNLGRCPSTTGLEPWPTRNRLPFAWHFNVSASIHGQISSTFQPFKHLHNSAPAAVRMLEDGDLWHLTSPYHPVHKHTHTSSESVYG